MRQPLNLIAQQRKMELDDTEIYIDKLEEEGMTVNKLTDEQKAEFRQALEPML